ncbi:8120_t:CDS:2, partial [Ambispora leptoticha]
ERETLFKNPSSTNFGVPALQEITAPHIESFNALFGHKGDKGGILQAAINDLQPMYVYDKLEETETETSRASFVKFWIDKITILRPMISENNVYAREKNLFPSECRERLITYQGRMEVRLNWTINDGIPISENIFVGNIPIMVKSARCNIADFYPKDLIRHHEEAEEMGGYFIINGIEKIIRLLLVPRRNYVMGIVRPSFQKRGKDYTKYATSIRCARSDQTTQTVNVHYLKDGNCMFSFRWRKQEYMVPVMLILKALADVSDKAIFDRLVQNETSNTFLTDRVELLLRSAKNRDLIDREDYLKVLGEKFRIVFNSPRSFSDSKAGDFLLDRIVLVHLKNNQQKYDLLIFMIRKLYAMVAGECSPDNPDSPANQEILLGGHLYGMLIKERLQDYLHGLRGEFYRRFRLSRKGTIVDTINPHYVGQIMSKIKHDTVGPKIAHFLATGNLVSISGMDLSQLKTTTIRKLLPEAWGFICPVHTPDGAPCGLLNHLSSSCQIITYPTNTSKLSKILYTIGVLDLSYSGNLGKDQKIMH